MILQYVYQTIQISKDKLEEMSHLPEPGLLVLSKAGLFKRFTWLLELKKVLHDMMELGNRREASALAKEAFSTPIINLVIKMLPAGTK